MHHQGLCEWRVIREGRNADRCSCVCVTRDDCNNEPVPFSVLRTKEWFVRNNRCGEGEGSGRLAYVFNGMPTFSSPIAYPLSYAFCVAWFKLH